MSPESRVGKRAEQKRRWDAENKTPCLDCGTLTARHRARCKPCESARRQQERDRVRACIARRYREGAPVAEVAAELDMSVKAVNATLTRMRADGWDVPRRKTFSGDSLARMGWRVSVTSTVEQAR